MNSANNVTSQLSFLETVDEIIGFTPEMTYATGTSINLFSQNIFSEKENLFSLSATQTRIGIDLWNEIDSVCSIYFGLRLLTDKNNYRRKSSIIQGILNIITGATMGYFTDNNQICLGLLKNAASTVLSSPVFALATACDLLNVSIDLYHTSQELEFKDWLKERLQELNFIEKRIREETPAENTHELAKLIHKKKQLHFQIVNRCLARADDPFSRQYIERILKNNHADLWEKCIYYSPAMISRAKLIDKNIQQKINNRYEAQKKIVFMKTLSFIGMTLLAIATFAPCPPLLIIGTAICTIVALYYLQKNAGNLFLFFKNSSKKQRPQDTTEEQSIFAMNPP